MTRDGPTGSIHGASVPDERIYWRSAPGSAKIQFLERLRFSN